MMRESVIYQEILEEGRQEGERLLVLRLLTRRVGSLPDALQSQIKTLPLDQLEALAEALLEFQSITDLEAWFNSQSA